MNQFKLNINNSEVEIAHYQAGNKPTIKYFVCTCKEEDEKFWANEMNTYLDGEDNKKLTSSLTMDLWHNHGIVINSMDCDMWFGICLEHSKYEFYIECDSIEYGLLCVLKISEYIISSGNIPC